MATTATEEYLQAIYALQDEGNSVISARLAEFLGVTAAAVSEMLHRLERDDLVILQDRKSIRLTERGLQLAERVTRRHRLAERMLVDLLGYEWWRTHDEAERIEHAMSDEMEERLRRVLGDPQTCPHGNPMPGVAPRAARPLESLTRGESARVERIPDQFEHEPGFLEYLAGEGIRPGVLVKLVGIEADGIRVQVEEQERRLRRDTGRKLLLSA